MHFTGKQRDAETNLDDFDARYYSSQMGRFMSADWSAVPAPVPYANLTNPQTLNLYAIVRDNPETFADRPYFRTDQIVSFREKQ
jgi:RHS repeat-associated protein